MEKEMIYLDHNATTPVDPGVLEAMWPLMKEEFGNPSSAYALGKRAKEHLEQSRKSVATLLGCESPEITFTSGGSESNNMVLKGVIDEVGALVSVWSMALPHPEPRRRSRTNAVVKCLL